MRNMPTHEKIELFVCSYGCMMGMLDDGRKFAARKIMAGWEVTVGQ